MVYNQEDEPDFLSDNKIVEKEIAEEESKYKRKGANIANEEVSVTRDSKKLKASNGGDFIEIAVIFVAIIVIIIAIFVMVSVLK